MAFLAKSRRAFLVLWSGIWFFSSVPGLSSELPKNFLSSAQDGEDPASAASTRLSSRASSVAPSPADESPPAGEEARDRNKTAQRQEEEDHPVCGICFECMKNLSNASICPNKEGTPNRNKMRN